MAVRRLFISALRGLTIRCPNCGHGFMRGLRVLTICPGCRLRLDRGEEGHFLGSMTFNLVTSELAVLALITASVVHALPDEPPRSLYVWAVASAFLLPVLLYPLSKTLWLTFDLWFRPTRPSDFAETPSP